MRIIALADIHGNSLALEAVLEDMIQYPADLVVNLGDCLSGPLLPAQTADCLLAQPHWLTVRGNHDRYLLDVPRDQMGPSDGFTADRLTDAHRAWLAGLAMRLDPLPGITALHGTAHRDDDYLLEQVQDGHLRLADEQTITARLAGVEGPGLLLCAHSHIPRLVQVQTLLIVNPGSVGLPAYSDDAPAHVAQTGSPHARYAILEQRQPGEGWEVTFRCVRYDWQAAAQQAEQAGRPDWAHALATGFAQPPR